MRDNPGLVDQINELLDSKLISIVGGGGKTSFMYHLAKELVRYGKKVVLTTTTHIAMPGPSEVGAVITSGMIDEVKRELNQHPAIAVATDDGSGKLSCIDFDLLEEIKQFADVILCEADGTRGLPFKAPRDYEPVIAPGSDTVVALCGISGLGKPIHESCHRPELVSEILHKQQDEVMTAKDLAHLLLSEQGQYKGVKDGQRYMVVINQVDGIREKHMADEVVKYLQAQEGLYIILSAFQTDHPIKEIIVGKAERNR